MPSMIIKIAHRGRRTWRFHAILLAICLLGFALRLWFCVEVSGHPFVTIPPDVTDMATYRALAERIAARDFPDTFYYQPFYYAVFLPLVLMASGNSPFAIGVVQSLLAALTIWMTGLLAAKLFGRRAGLFAAAFLAVSRYHILYTPFALMAVLLSFFLVLMTAAVLAAWQSNRVWHWGAAGLVTGLAVLTRGNILLLVPGAVVVAAWRGRRRPVQAALAICLFLVLMYLPQLPFAWRNFKATGRWTGPSTAADAVLALGNTPEAPPGIPGATYYPATYHTWMQKAQREGPDRVPVARQIRSWVRREPFAYAELKFRMALLFWHQMEIPNNIYIGQFTAISRVIDSPWLIDFGIIGTLALAGLLVWLPRSRHSPRRLYLYWSILAFWGATVLFYIIARFRVPLLPLTCVAAGAFVEHAWRLMRHRGPWERRTLLSLICGLASLALGAAVVLYGYRVYHERLEAAVMRMVRPHGVVAEHPDARHLHDHGPPVMGGWTTVKIPHGGMRIRKSFSVPPVLADSEHALTALRLPVIAPAGGTIAVTAFVGQQRAGSQEFELEAESRHIQWLDLPVRRMRLDAAGVMDTNLICRFRAPQPIYVVVDAARDYGRTSLVDVDGAAVPSPGEIAVQSVWRRGSGTPPP